MSYDEDYVKAKADGSLLDPMPDDYTNVRVLVEGIGQLDLSTVFAILKHEGIPTKYDKYFESFVAPADKARAVKILEKG